MSERICKVCGLPFPETTEYFYHATIAGKVHLHRECKECTLLEQAKRDHKNRFKASERYYERKRCAMLPC